MPEPTEIKIGPLVFEYDGRGMGVGNTDELYGYAEPIRPDEWAAFVAAATANREAA